jgi:hypothetical protein
MNLDSDPLASSTESLHVSHAHGDASNAYAYTAVSPSLPLRLPLHFDVIVDFCPHSLPFTQRVRPTMTHHQLLIILSAVVGVNSALLFTFLNNQIRHGSSRLLCDDPPLYPGCTLRLVKWSFYDARRFYQAYNALPSGEEHNLYWHFDLNCFTSSYPRPTVLYQPGMPVDVVPDVALTTFDSEPGFDCYSPDLAMHVRGRAINHAPAYYPPMVALLAQHPVPVLFQLDRSFVRRLPQRGST